MAQKTKHQKRLQEIHNKKIERQIRFRPQRFSLWDFLLMYPAEVLVAVMIICMLIFIPRWTSSLNKQNTSPSESSISEELKQELLGKYPNGFKLMELRNWDLRPLDDTLSSDFKVDWEGARLVQFAGRKIRIKIPTVYHGPTGRALKNLIVEFERNHRQIIRMNQLTGFDLLAEIISDDGEKMMFLFSFEVTK